MPLIHAFGHTLRYLSARTEQSDSVAIAESQRIVQAVSRNRRAIEAETIRFCAEFAKTEADKVQHIATAIVEAADAAWTRRVRVFDRNTAMLAGFILFAVGALCLAGGAWWGHSRAYADIHETEAGLRQAFRDGPDTARAWRELIEWNDLRGSLLACKEVQGRIHIQDGRRWCEVPLWLQKPANPQQ
jgi:hypothetical protein